MVLLVFHVVLTFWSRAALKRIRQEMAESGESLDFHDFLPPDVPGRENASSYLEAMAALIIPYRYEPWNPPDVQGDEVENAGGDRTLVEEMTRVIGLVDHNQLRAGGDDLGKDDLEVLRAGVERFDTLYRLFDEARYLERARYDITYSDALAIEYEVPSQIPRMIMARLLEARAILAIHEGRPEDAYRDAAGIFRLAGWVDQETPALIATLNVSSIAYHGIRTVNHLMQVSPPPPGAEERILEEAGRVDARALFKRALGFERSIYFSTLVDPDFEFAYYRPYTLLAAVDFAESMTRAMNDSDPPAWQRGPDPESLEDHIDRYSSGPFSLATRLMLPPCYHYNNRRDALQARQHILTLAFRLETYHRLHETYPERLDMLGDPQPMDPFSGDSYRYRPVDGGYLLYSVAGNRTDDGGIPLKKPWKIYEGDIVWRIE